MGYDLSGWGIYGSNGWGSCVKVSYCFAGDVLKKKKALASGEYISGHHMTTQVWVPLNSQPVFYYGKGGTTPRLRLTFSEEPSSRLAITKLRIF